MATIGLRDVHYALLTNDPSTGTPNYGVITPVKGAISCSVNPNTSAATLFADDGPYDAATTMGEIEVELNLADLPPAVSSVWLGHAYGDDGIIVKKSTDVPPWLALGYRTLKSNGYYRYKWLPKGKFAAPQEEENTKADTVEFTTPTITGAFVKRDCDDKWELAADADDTKTGTATTIANWFAGVNCPLGTVEGSLSPLAPSSGTAPTITTISPLIAGTKDTAYTATIVATGNSPITYSVAIGSTLPTGLSLNSSSGVISGTPTVAGTYTFSLTAANNSGTNTKVFTLVIAP